MKRTLFIILPFVIVLTLAGWYIISKKTGPQGGAGDNSSSGGIFAGLFPTSGDNTSASGETPSGAQGGDFQGGGVGSSDSGLHQLTAVPVAGFVSTTTVSGSALRYVERATGNVFQIKDGRTERLTNTTIPAVYEALWNKNASMVALRYLNENDVIKTHLAAIVENASSTATTATTTISSLEGEDLQDDIPYMTLSKDGTKLVYVAPTGSGATIYETPFTSKSTALFSTPFSEWKLSVLKSDAAIATTYASAITDGFAYAVDKDGNFSKILGPIKGLTTLVDPSGDRLLYAESKDDRVAMKLFHMNDGLTVDMPISTLPEKCAWSPNTPTLLYCGIPKNLGSDSYPDAWYKGEVSFEDDLWEIDTQTNSVRVLAALPASTPVDVIDPIVTEDGTTLYFINKKDSTLWSLALPAPVTGTESTTTSDGTSS